MTNPVLVNAWRGDVLECRHRGAIAVCDPRGRIVQAWGNVEALVYPRSAIKPLQALPLVESGAADRFNVSAAELALACASHGGQPAHTTAIAAWLKRIGLDPGALECGPHPPLHAATGAQLLRDGVEPGRIHNNCSGKHTGMLATARHLCEETRGYIRREHPAQQRWFDALGELAGVDVRRLPCGLDGCGIPVIALPLRAIATAFARVAVPDDLPAGRADALERITGAMAAHPFMVGGSARLCTELMRLTGRRLLIKTGAAGVFSAILREPGLGVALKIDDGLTAASEVALLALLQRLGALRADELEALGERARIPIRNTRGACTGFREPSQDW